MIKYKQAVAVKNAETKLKKFENLLSVSLVHK